MQKTNIIYGVSGLIIGALITLGICALVTMNRSHSMQAMMDAMTERLDGKVGDEFDKIFLEEMIMHHQGAVSMAGKALVQSNRLEIKTMADEIITAQTDEIAQMEGWLSDWFQVNHTH